MAKPVPPSLNMLERAGAAVSPKWGMRRLMAKSALALAGGYAGASRNRPAMRNWTPDAVSPDDEVAYDLPTLRARSRDLIRNAPLAGGAVNTSVTHVIGTGLSMQSRIDRDYLGLGEDEADAWQAATEREFSIWAESTDCDVTRAQDFYGLQSLAFRAMCESGDVLGLLASVERKTTPYSLSIQLIEADRICNADGLRNSDTLIDGVEINASGEAIRYHVASRYPVAYSVAKGITWRKVEARGSNTDRLNAIHLFERLRPGQTRGVPMLAPVIEPLKQLGRYTNAELAAAVNASIWTVFVKMDPEAFEGLFEDDARKDYIKSASKWDGTVGSGDIDDPARAVNLLPGESIDSPEPGRPSSQFDPFVKAIVAQIGARLGIPFQMLMKLYDQSYTAARASFLDAWRMFRGRRDFMETHFCKPIYELWLEEAIGLGRIQAPGFFADPARRKAWLGSAWVGDSPGSLDPLKEVQAARERIDQEISTRADESILHDGKAWEPKHRQRAKEERLRQEDGTIAAAQPAQPEPPQEQPSALETGMVSFVTAMQAIALREPVAPTVTWNQAPAPAQRLIRRIPVRDPETGMIIDVREVPEDEIDED